jgi:streptogrisin D
MIRLRPSARLFIATALSAVVTTTSLGGAAAADPVRTRMGQAAVQPAGEYTKLTAEQLRIAEESARDNPGNKVEAWARVHNALGVSADNAGRFTITLPATAAAGSLAELDTSGVGVPMTVKLSTLTRSDIDATVQKLHDFAARNRHYTFGFWYDAGRDAVVVHGNLTGEPAGRLRASAGKVVVDADPTATGGRDACERYADCGPHDGGALISSDGYRCSSGFAMLDWNGDDYQVTAGHCFPQGYHLASGPHYYGTVAHKMTYPYFDLEKISGNCCLPQSYRGRIWTSSYGFVAVSGASNADVGYPGRTGICVSGQANGSEQCGASVRSTSATFCNADGCTSGLMLYSRGSGSQMTWNGDSGAPVYFRNQSNNLAHVVGMHIARSCSGECLHYAEKYTTIQNSYGGHIMVG